MSGYLDEYGAGEEKKENLIRNSIIIAVVAIGVFLVGFYLFHPYHQISVTKTFLNKLKAKDYSGAYAAWGCTGGDTCKDYSYQKFLEDWGPKSTSAASPTLKIADIESCGDGDIVTVNASPGNQQKLFVEKGSNSLSFSPVQICAGKSTWSIMLHRTLGHLRQILF